MSAAWKPDADEIVRIRVRHQSCRTRTGLEDRMAWRRSSQTVLLVAVMAGAAACSGGSPTKASDPIPNFQGSYTGTSSVTSCTEDRNFAGFCDGVGFTSGATFPMTVNLSQSQSTVTGTIAMLGLS